MSQRIFDGLNDRFIQFRIRAHHLNPDLLAALGCQIPHNARQLVPHPRPPAASVSFITPDCSSLRDQIQPLRCLIQRWVEFAPHPAATDCVQAQVPRPGSSTYQAASRPTRMVESLARTSASLRPVVEDIALNDTSSDAGAGTAATGVTDTAGAVIVSTATAKKVSLAGTASLFWVTPASAAGSSMKSCAHSSRAISSVQSSPPSVPVASILSNRIFILSTASSTNEITPGVSLRCPARTWLRIFSVTCAVEPSLLNPKKTARSLNRVNAPKHAGDQLLVFWCLLQLHDIDIERRQTLVALDQEPAGYHLGRLRYSRGPHAPHRMTAISVRLSQT